MKIVLIGAGGWGKNHCRVLSEFGVLSAVCDVNAQRAEEFGKKYSVNFYNRSNLCGSTRKKNFVSEL